MFDPESKFLSIQRPFAEDQGRRECRVLGKVRGVKLLANYMVLENSRDDLLDNLLLAVFVFVVVVVAVELVECALVDDGFESGKELELVGGLYDVIVEERLDTRLVEQRMPTIGGILVLFRRRR